MDVTPSKRSQIVALRQHSGLSIRQIVDRLDIAKSTVGKMVKAADEDGDISIYRSGRCRRKRKTTSHDDKMIIRNSVKSPWKTSKDLQSDLGTSGVLIDPSIISRRLFSSEKIARKPTKKQLLATKIKKKRLQWAKKYRSGGTDQWEKVIFSDKTHFEVCGYHSCHDRRSIDEPQEAHIRQAPKYPPKKMFWGFFTGFGPGSFIPIEGMMNLDKYKNILANYLLPILSDNDFRADAFFSKISHLKENANLFCKDWYKPVRLARKFSRLKPNQKSLGNNQKKTFRI